jgi:hypothetical protein
MAFFLAVSASTLAIANLSELTSEYTIRRLRKSISPNKGYHLTINQFHYAPEDKLTKDLFLSFQKVVELVELTIDPPELMPMLMLRDELKVEPIELP